MPKHFRARGRIALSGGGRRPHGAGRRVALRLLSRAGRRLRPRGQLVNGVGDLQISTRAQYNLTSQIDRSKIMKQIQASTAKAQFSELLDDVERRRNGRDHVARQADRGIRAERRGSPQDRRTGDARISRRCASTRLASPSKKFSRGAMKGENSRCRFVLDASVTASWHLARRGRSRRSGSLGPIRYRRGLRSAALVVRGQEYDADG